MIKLFSLKKQQQQESASSNAASTTDKKKVTAAQIRLQKDLSELELPKTMQLDVPNADDLLNFHLTITPDEGIYRGGAFRFSFSFKTSYPHDPPKVQLQQTIYHPNIDLDGNVCLNILREDWKPVLNLQSIVVGLQFLFLEPNPDDPLNKDAANMLRQNKSHFEQLVRSTMSGGSINGKKYDNVLARK